MINYGALGTQQGAGFSNTGTRPAAAQGYQRATQTATLGMGTPIVNSTGGMSPAGAGGFGYNLGGASGNDAPMTAGQGIPTQGAPAGGGITGTTAPYRSTGVDARPGRGGAGGPGGAVSPFSGATMGAIDPNNDLRGQQILPGQSAQTRTASGMADTAASQYSQHSFTPFQSQGPFTSSGTSMYGAIGPNQIRQAGTTNTSGAQGYMDKGEAALSGGVRGQGLSALADLAATGGDGGGGFSYAGPGADVAKARASAMSALDNAMTGTDRAKIAADTFDLTAARGDDAFNRAVRQTGQKAAALGRAGSGMVNTDLADVTTARGKELDFLRRDLALDAANKSLQDRMDLTNLGTSTANSFADSDRGDAGLNLAGAQLGEQSASRRASNRMQAAGSLVGAGEFDAQFQRGLGQARFGMDATNTQERGRDVDRATETDRFNTGLRERQSEFQYGADRDTYDRGVNERDTARRDEYDQGDFMGNRFESMAGWLDNRENRDASNRGEIRGERDYQTSLGRQAMEDERTRMFDEEDLRDRRYNRASGTAALGFGAQNPSGAYNNAAGNATASAGNYYSALGPMAQYMASRGGSNGGSNSRRSTDMDGL